MKLAERNEGDSYLNVPKPEFGNESSIIEGLITNNELIYFFLVISASMLYFPAPINKRAMNTANISIG